MILLVILSLLGYSLCEESPKYPENTADISSINNLAYKPSVILDPKIRKALLNVLNRLEEEEKITEIGHEKSSSEKHEHQNPLPDEIKWVLKTNDTFKIYHFSSNDEKLKQKNNKSPSDDRKWDHISNTSPSDGVNREYIGNDTFKEYYSPSNNVKWEYKIKSVTDDEKWEHKIKSSSDEEKGKYKVSDSPPHDDTFREFTYYQIEQDKHPSTSPKYTKDENLTELLVPNEPEALFFQTPEHEKEEDPGKEKHESLNLQETKSVITPDEIFSHLEDEIMKKKKLNKSNNSSSNPKLNTSEDGVEFFQAPLLTAFTLEQDERGLPRRIIPLDTDELKSILNNKLIIDSSQEPRKAREPQTHSESSLSHNEHKKFQINLESQLLELQEQKRQLDFEKQKFLLEQEKQKLLIEQENTRRLKHTLELKEKEHFLRTIKQNEIPRQEVFLQKSIPLQVHNNPLILQPALPFTRIQYHNKPQFEFPETVDRQLLTLFQRSGINQGKHEDLNIVSKVLALNYGENEKPKISTERILNVRENFRNKRRLMDNFYRS